MLFKKNTSKQERLNQLDERMRRAHDGLIAEYIRGELINWNNQLGRLKRAVSKSDYEDWYIERVADDFVKSITGSTEIYHYERDFLEAIQLFKEHIISKAVEIDPDFNVYPSYSLIELAHDGRLNELIDEINELEKCVRRI